MLLGLQPRGARCLHSGGAAPVLCLTRLWKHTRSLLAGFRTPAAHLGLLPAPAIIHRYEEGNRRSETAQIWTLHYFFSLFLIWEIHHVFKHRKTPCQALLGGFFGFVCCFQCRAGSWCGEGLLSQDYDKPEPVIFRITDRAPNLWEWSRKTNKEKNNGRQQKTDVERERRTISH